MPARALVLDDSRATRMMLRRILGQIGYDEIVEAEHGIAGLEQLEAHNDVELALVDWNMPEMNGYDFLCAVREDERWAGLTMVMVTTESEIDNVMKALEAGANEYIMKPFTPAVLREKLELLGLGGDA